MRNPPDSINTSPTEASVKSVLEWLALAHDRTGADDAEELYQQLLLLREAPLPSAQRLKLLDLLYSQAERIVRAQLPALQEVSLPISRKLRQRVRILLDVMSTLTQDYFNTLADLFDPTTPPPLRAPGTSLRRVMHSIAWQVRITHLVASPTPLGLWQQLHAAYRTARRLGQEHFPGPGATPSIHRIYTGILLTAIAQPASFSSEQLEFISDYVATCLPDLDLQASPPPGTSGVFWLDPDKDVPAHALIRRIPSPEPGILFFSCDVVAATALQHHDELKAGASAELLGLPPFADSHTGSGVLKRLSRLWGQPAKRRFPRRRQSYRAQLCSGLGNLWSLMKSTNGGNQISEWMVTNESPDGYALMHMSGQTSHLRVGDIVALQTHEEKGESTPAWHICIIRWALSENPAHVEIGLQMLAPRAIPVELASAGPDGKGKVPALILPATPPLRPTQSLVVPTGLLREDTHRVVVLLEDGNLKVQELHAAHLDEQTCSIEIFTVLPETSH